MRKRLRTFFEFTQGNGGENPTIPVNQSQTPPNNNGVENSPPTPENGGTGPGSQVNDPAAMEDLTNSLRKISQKFIAALQKKRISHSQAMELFSAMTAEIANATGLTLSQQKQALATGVRTNSEPSTPQTQPMANG